MRRTASLIVALLVVVSAIAVAPATALAQDDTDDGGDEVAPGERLSGVLGVQEAEFEGEMDERTFGVKVAGAASDDAKADVVGEQLDDVETRVDELEQRKAELAEQRENGEISEGEYQAKMSKVEAERQTAQRLAERSNETAGELPADVLAEKGIDVDAIRTLRDRAANMTGPEVAEMARSIAGPDVGAGTTDAMSDAVPDDVGPDAGDRGGPGNQTDVDAGAPDNETDAGGGGPADGADY